MSLIRMQFKEVYKYEWLKGKENSFMILIAQWRKRIKILSVIIKVHYMDEIKEYDLGLFGRCKR